MTRNNLKAFKVHVGYTANGRSRYRYFATIADASKFCEEVRRATRIILSIEICEISN